MSGEKRSAITYDFFSKSLKDIALNRNNQEVIQDYKGIPAEVVGVSDYEEYQCVDVKFLINDTYIERDNLVLESLTLKRVFVALQSSGGFSIKQPVAVGDKVRLNWAHRDLGDFLDGDGSAVTLKVTEKGRIEDCWVELGFGTRKSNTSPSLTDFIIEGPSTLITITPEGNCSLVNNGTTINIDPTGNVSLVTNGTSSITSSAHTITAPTVINGILTITGDVIMGSNLAVAGIADITGELSSGGALVTGHTHNNQVPPMA